MTVDPWSPGQLPAAPRRRRAFPRIGDGLVARVDLLESYLQLAAVAMARAEFYGQLLAEQIEQAEDEDGSAVRGVIAEQVTVSVVGNGSSAELVTTVTGEEVRALVELEAKERDRAAKLVRDAVAMGATLQQVEVMRSYGSTIAAALQTFAIEAGLSLDDEPTLRAAQRAGLTARRSMGFDDPDPDVTVGPRLSATERVRALREALQRAEQDALRVGAAS